ncbi:MAG: 3-chlorobenzoate-3,4-dioxygenase [Verrucomicrobiales bacterium]|nr:3-chlorobenzoate-3,4-dioxygenase [Verrucomicrobiales bacterium]
MTHLQTRRHFLASALTLAAAAASPKVLHAGPKAGTYKAAVIGHTGRGDYGHGLDGIFSERKNIELVAIADPDEPGRTKAASNVKPLRTYSDYREMLAKERPHLVSVAMRHADLHYPAILDCLKADAHVYSEKPFVTAPNEADELLSLARKSELRIAVAHTMRMMPIIVRLKQGIREGLIGDLVEMRAYGKQDSRAGGEDMMVLGSHLFDLMRFFAGSPVSCSARVLQSGHPITREDRRMVKDNIGYVAGDTVFSQFAFENGINGTFTSAAKLRDTMGHWGIELFGSKGAARINCDISPNVFLRRATAWSAKGKADTWEPLDSAMVQSPPEHNLGPVGDWLQAIEQKRDPECSGRNGAWAVEMVCAVYQSALTNASVPFPLLNRAHPLT